MPKFTQDTAQHNESNRDVRTLRPMRRLASKTVFSAFMAACDLAASPMRRSVSVKATYEGVVRLPWSLAMISTRSFCQTPTQE